MARSASLPTPALDLLKVLLRVDKTATRATVFLSDVLGSGSELAGDPGARPATAVFRTWLGTWSERGAPFRLAGLVEGIDRSRAQCRGFS